MGGKVIRIGRFLLTTLVFLAITLFVRDHFVEGGGTDRVYGVIRPDSSGKWFLLNDGGHISKNIKSVGQTDKFIRVCFDTKFSKIHYSAITADDSLVNSGIAGGASVGFECLYIFSARNGERVNPNMMKSSGMNYWILVEGEY